MKKVKFNDNWVCGCDKFLMYEERQLTPEQYAIGKDLKTGYDINKPLFTEIEGTVETKKATV